jgi:hypothetical protein
MVNSPEYLPGLLIAVFALAIVMAYTPVSWVVLLVSVGSGLLVYSMTSSIWIATLTAVIALVLMAKFVPRIDGFANTDVPADLAAEMKKIKESTYENFNTHTPPDQIASGIRKMKHIEGFNTNVPSTQIASLIEQMKNGKINEGFANTVAANIAQNGLATPGFGINGPLVEGYEDVKNEKPAPAAKASLLEGSQKATEMLGKPFTLGEIPSQAKNGPHIDISSTLMNAVNSLNPDQIKAMSKDTQQLIETQKSLMGMLGSMKPMLNDGKQLMETFQQMFGQ